MASSLKSLEIHGYKTIREARIELARLNVLVGANGAGKSNFVSFLGLLGHVARGEMQLQVARAGGACALLYYGPKVTGSTRASMTLDTASGPARYSFSLAHAPQDCLIFARESTGAPGAEHDLGHGHREALIAGPHQTALPADAAEALRRLFVYQFHDTSATARIKQGCYIEDNRALAADGGNLASVLLRIKTAHPDYYTRITATLRQSVPFFGDFELLPSRLNERMLQLEWREGSADRIFGSHELSDGTLRLMCLVTLLLQPPEMMPPILVIDEPELGVHPFAINVLAALVRQASLASQVIIATQSVTLLNHFDPGDVIVTERHAVDHQHESVFHRLEEGGLEEWLKDYSLGELWEKNVIGGRP